MLTNFIFLLLLFCTTTPHIYAQEDLFQGFEITNVGSTTPHRNTNQQQPVQRKQNNTSSNTNGNVKTWREDTGYGFVIVKQYPNGIQIRTSWNKCPNCRGNVICAGCRGSGRCALCGGQGGIITSGYGQYIPCTSCQRTGICRECSGKGRCMCSQYDYPGYVIGATTSITPDGNVDRYSVNGGSHSSSSSSTTTCSKCRGRRYESTPYNYAPASAHGWMQPYHHKGGSGCPYCSNTTAHYHHPCNACRGYGHK